MNQLSIRLRLTLLVTGVFVCALLVAGSAARHRLETTLIETARSNAEATLQSSFFPSPAVVDNVSIQGAEGPTIQGITRFIFTDVAGNELGQSEFASAIDEATAAELAELGFFLPFDGALSEGFVEFESDGVVGFVDGVSIAQPLEPFGDPVNSLTAEEIVVSQPVKVGSQELTISVATPRQPLDDSLAAFTYLGLMLVPLLGSGVALATWTTTARVLRPVEDIRRQVEQTDSGRLALHVPRSGNGDEIDRLAGTMNDMLDRLRVASERQRQFVSDASHELRSPITATLATLETTDPELLGASWPQIEATLTAEQTRLSRLVDDLLLLATVDEGRAGPRFSDVDLDDLVLSEAGRPYSVDVNARVVAPHRVVGNSDLLQRCLRNLVENAARHASSTVEVTITTSAGGHPVIRVEDDGPGIPEGQLESIFERFARIDGARNRREGGAGLGLSIARYIAQQHSASLTASNRPNGGACFELVFGAMT